MKKILVPVDFSEHSEYALEVACRMAKQNAAEIVVLHMLGITTVVYNTGEAQEMAEANYYMKLAKQRFKKFLDKEYLKGIKLTEIIQNYKIFSEINQVAQEQQIDLIVMGSHGSSGLSALFVGSNTEKVVRTSRVPVLVIKKHLPDFKLERVVFASDFEMESIPAYRKAVSLLQSLGAKLHLLYVNLPNGKFKSSKEMELLTAEFLQEANKGDFKENPPVVYECAFSIERGIYHYSHKIKADLIALTTHGHRGMTHFFKGSIGEDIANRADVPVMTFLIY
ncbi:Nucleotide-binding universal stress protein, UspA family [Arenibacter nanhaiticus]|uniref:Nucleotide-binding universal stress protein, UspA family n=1 Tax=Arenibacter nanhaiticus TaxID=558155 RepID=A0A1M6JC92_9FLAO|nr:universal stress protein [Arenibacter nanhaiticus]SHJ44250.1 Nucleotide-binding universal stress protein, UspA family [Arenibacter nanhaiticus]